MTDLQRPFPFQAIGAQYLAERDQAFLADDMGLGKSCQCICAADLVHAKDILVICPANVRVNWEREFERFSPFDRPSFVVFTGKDLVPLSGVVICSYETALAHAPRLKSKMWDVLILDEAHFLKERTAKRTKMVYGRNSAFPGLTAKAKRVWRVSGTPAPNDASEMWTHLKSAGITKENYWDFVYRFCAGYDSGFGFKITGHKNVDELKTLMGKFMIRRLKEEVMPELPNINFEEFTVERGEVVLDPDFYEHIQKKGEEDFFARIKQSDTVLKQSFAAVKDSRMPAEDRLRILEATSASMITLRRYIGMAKLDACCEKIAAELAGGRLRKVVIFGIHQCVIEGARQRLRKFGAVTLYGNTPPATRQKNIDKFIKNPACRVFIGNVNAAGIGIDGLQKVCHDVIFFEQSWVPSDNAQAAMRVHRIGQTKPVRVRVFNLYKSIDEQVQRTLLRKMQELLRLF